MNKILPFRAWRYRLENKSDASRVVAPPYDVINSEELKILQGRSPHNVVWVDLPQDEKGQDRYALAGERYGAWKKQGVLRQDTEPSLYVYFQSYALDDGRRLTRKGFFARRRLEGFEDGGVKPHEKTFAGPKEDRFKLMRTTHANLSPIFGLYSDATDEAGRHMTQVTQGPPDMEWKTEDGQEHRLWKLSDPKIISDLLEPIQAKHILIADGHHRYETALHYKEVREVELGEIYRGDEAFNFVLMYFCRLEDPGLVVLPTHRVLAERPEVPPELVIKLLSPYASFKEFSVKDAEAVQAYMAEEGGREHLIAWVHDDKISVMLFDQEKLLQSEELNHLHFALRDLDVTILHNLVFEEVLGIPKGAQREYGTILYVKDMKETIRQTQEKNSYGFLLNPTKIAQMEAVTEIGETMPQKSTFFYPKIPTGIVFNDLE
jgi:uncharacterized protein (DUF1015 family)